jgi:antitoxin component HigA of HigAB toxin-antitoxin module
MSTTTLKKRTGAPVKNAARVDADYLAPIEVFPLRPIRTRGDYDRAAAVADRLAVRELTKAESDYLDVLADLITAYDRGHVTLGRSGDTPAERLRSLLEDAGMTATQLAAELGIPRSAVSMMLSGARGVSKANARKLGERFKLNPSYFL